MPERKPTGNKYGVNRSLSLSDKSKGADRQPDNHREQKKIYHISKIENFQHTDRSPDNFLRGDNIEAEIISENVSDMRENRNNDSGRSSKKEQRLRRAAYIEQKNAEAIRLNRAYDFSEENRAGPEYAEKNDTVPAEDTREHRRENENSDSSSIPDYPQSRDRTDEIHGCRIKQASQDFAEKRRRTRQEELRIKKDMQGVQTAAGEVNRSETVSGAAMDVSAALASIEAKKMLKKLADTDIIKQKRAEERAKRNGNRYGIKRYDEVVNGESSYSADKKSEENASEEQEQNKNGRTGNSRKMQEEKKEYAEKQYEKQIRNKRKEIYFRDNEGAVKEIVCGVPSGRELIKGAVRKKAVSVIIGGGAIGIAVPILIVIIVFVLFIAFFSWLTPFKYTLAGDSAGAEPHAAETKAEILDGYTLMIKNYMDVTQAYYYLTYGDWYGGTYDYSSEGLVFGRYLEDYCRGTVSRIQSEYQQLLSNARSEAEARAIVQSMQYAIENAVSNAYPAALDSYRSFMVVFDDMKTASEQRQPYEVSDSGGSNGVEDSAEFTGKPVVGTNLFGNKEINCELSAEELLAYIALYKSLKLLDASGDSGGSEQVLNITPEDINEFFEKTEFFSITADITDNHACAGENCKRRVIGEYIDGYEWEYYCDHDHQNLTGEIGVCKTADELIQKILELTNAEEAGITEDNCRDIAESTVEMIKTELNIDESGFRRFGAADNSKAQEFYQALIRGTLTNTDLWEVETPIPSPPEESP